MGEHIPTHVDFIIIFVEVLIFQIIISTKLEVRWWKCIIAFLLLIKDVILIVFVIEFELSDLDKWQYVGGFSNWGYLLLRNPLNPLFLVPLLNIRKFLHKYILQ